MKQTKAYNCGPASMIYWMRKMGAPECMIPSIDSIEVAVKCQPEQGTRPENMARWLHDRFPVLAYG